MASAPTWVFTPARGCFVGNLGAHTLTLSGCPSRCPPFTLPFLFLLLPSPLPSTSRPKCLLPILLVSAPEQPGAYLTSVTTWLNVSLRRAHFCGLNHMVCAILTSKETEWAEVDEGEVMKGSVGGTGSSWRVLAAPAAAYEAPELLGPGGVPTPGGTPPLRAFPRPCHKQFWELVRIFSQNANASSKVMTLFVPHSLVSVSRVDSPDLSNEPHRASVWRRCYVWATRAGARTLPPETSCQV